MLHCLNCNTERKQQDVITGIYFCRKCGYQGTLVVYCEQKKEKEKL